MSLFPRSFISRDPTTSFHPLFRLLDDFDQYNRDPSSEAGNHRHSRQALKTFAPKFDVKELADSYELHGELPGIEQKDVEIEFTDSQTLTVRGHTERSYTSGTPPTGSIEDSMTSGAITEGSEGKEKKNNAESAKDNVKDKKATEVAAQDGKSAKPEAKYWVSERSIGEFSRSFNFPSRVDQDNVRASMKNGILSIVVPKSNKPESRKITIS